jgi:hypothetical protein
MVNLNVVRNNGASEMPTTAKGTKKLDRQWQKQQQLGAFKGVLLLHANSGSRIAAYELHPSRASDGQQTTDNRSLALLNNA